jgi:hypothetical protein
MFQDIRRAMRTRSRRTPSVNLGTADPYHFILYRREMETRITIATECLQMWQEYEIGNLLCREFPQASTQELQDAIPIDIHETRTAKKIHQIFRHAPWSIPNLEYVRVSDFRDLSSRRINALEARVATEAQSTITLNSEEVEDFWHPILQDNPDQFLQGLISVFQGPSIRVRSPQDPTFVPYFVEENLIDWRAPDFPATAERDDVIDDVIPHDIPEVRETRDLHDEFADLISFSDDDDEAPLILNFLL